MAIGARGCAGSYNGFRLSTAASCPYSSCSRAGPLHQYSCVLSCLRKRVTMLNSRMTHDREYRVWPSGSPQPLIRYLNSSAEESTSVLGAHPR